MLGQAGGQYDFEFFLRVSYRFPSFVALPCDRLGGQDGFDAPDAGSTIQFYVYLAMEGGMTQAPSSPTAKTDTKRGGRQGGERRSDPELYKAHVPNSLR